MGLGSKILFAGSFAEVRIETPKALAESGNIEKLDELAAAEPPNPEAMYWAGNYYEKQAELKNNFHLLKEAFDYYKAAASWGHQAAAKSVVFLNREYKDELCNASLAGPMLYNIAFNPTFSDGVRNLAARQLQVLAAEEPGSQQAKEYFGSLIAILAERIFFTGTLTSLLAFIETQVSFLLENGMSEDFLTEIHEKFKMIEGIAIENPAIRLDESIDDFSLAYARDEYAETLFGVVSQPEHAFKVLDILDHYAAQAYEILTEKSGGASAPEARTDDEDEDMATSLYQIPDACTPPPRGYVSAPATPVRAAAEISLYRIGSTFTPPHVIGARTPPTERYTTVTTPR